MTPNSQITIDRSSEYINRMRNYQILLDGKKIGTIANGETHTFDIPAGNHKLHFEIDWTSSPVETFELGEGECKSFTVSGFKNANWLMPLGLILAVFSPILSGVLGSNFFLLLGAPIFLVLTYHITFGRKRYLSVEAVA